MSLQRLLTHFKDELPKPATLLHEASLTKIHFPPQTRTSSALAVISIRMFTRSCQRTTQEGRADLVFYLPFRCLALLLCKFNSSSGSLLELQANRPGPPQMNWLPCSVVRHRIVITSHSPLITHTGIKSHSERKKPDRNNRIAVNMLLMELINSCMCCWCSLV